MAEAVLDASAILALLLDEPGARHVGEIRERCKVCTVNHSEVVARLVRHGLPREQLGIVLAALTYELVDFDADLAWRTAMLAETTRSAGLSLGDRACLALAEREGLPAVTADRAWAELRLEAEVILVR